MDLPEISSKISQIIEFLLRKNESDALQLAHEVHELVEVLLMGDCVSNHAKADLKFILKAFHDMLEEKHCILFQEKCLSMLQLIFANKPIVLSDIC
jgi:hypothetical protein